MPKCLLNFTFHQKKKKKKKRHYKSIMLFLEAGAVTSVVLQYLSTTFHT